MGASTWLVIAAVIGVVAFAVFQRDTEVPDGRQALPVVGADLHSLVIDPEKPSRLFIGSHQGVSVSNDRGQTWEAVETLAGADAMGWAFTNDAIYIGGHPGISVSTDGGASFQQRNDSLPSTDVHALGAGEDVVYAGIAGVGTFASPDGGSSWEQRSKEFGAAFMGRIVVDPADDDHVLAPDMQGGAVESVDGGRTWEVLGGVQGAMWVSWNRSDIGDMIVVGMGAAARSSDGGETWSPMNIPQGASIVEFAPDDPKTVYAAVHEDPHARIWISRDGGETWEKP